MLTLTTKNGNSLECKAIIKETNSIQIYTDKLTPEEAFKFFGNSEEISELTSVWVNDKTGEEDEIRILKRYTVIFQVLKYTSDASDNTIMVWLQKPIEQGGTNENGKIS